MPLLPVRATVIAPRFFASSIPNSTFFDLPLVLMPMTTSPFSAHASICLENTFLKP